MQTDTFMRELTLSEIQSVTGGGWKKAAGGLCKGSALPF